MLKRKRIRDKGKAKENDETPSGMVVAETCFQAMEIPAT